MQKLLFPVRAVKLSRLKGSGIGPRTETGVNWGGFITLVPCLHQANIYIKREIGVWRDQKCNPLVDAKNPLTCAVVKLHRLKGGGMGPIMETCANWGGSIALIPCLHQGNIYSKRQPGVWRDQKCIPLVGAETPLTCAYRQITTPQRRRYWIANGNLRKLGKIYGLGTVFAPRHYLYQKGATGMERPDKHSPIRCKKPCSL